MFGKKTVKEDTPVVPEVADLEVPVEEPKVVGMPGFTEDVPTKVEEPKAAPVPAPVEKKTVEQYQIIETAVAGTQGLYIYKIVTNKYLGELGGVYEA